MRLRATRLSAISNAMRSVFKIASVSPVLWWDAESHRAGLTGGAATLFQDSAGTSAVTAVEQPVGRAVDQAGNARHALQATSTARPLLTARKNLLTFSEQFDNAAWSKVNGPVVLSNVATAPDGATSADSVQATTGGDYRYISSPFFNVGQNATVTASIYVKKETTETVLGGIGIDFQGGARRLVYIGFNAVTGVAVNIPGGNLTPTLSVVDAGDYWRLIVTVTDTGSNPDVLMQYYANISIDGTSVNGWTSASSPKVIWGAQLELGSAATGYQRVAAANDYDITAAPLMLQFDGVDDSLASATFDAGTLPADADVYLVMHRNANDGRFVVLRGQGAGVYVGAFETTTSTFGNSASGSPAIAINGAVISGSVTPPVEVSFLIEARGANLGIWTSVNHGVYSAGWQTAGRIGCLLITPAKPDATRAKIRKALAKTYQIQGVV